MRVISPRRPWHSSMTVPVYSLGVMMVAESIGSSMWSSRVASGSSVGLSTSSSVPSVRKARYATLGAVAMSERSNSRSRRSRTISMCRRPRKPQRKPMPRAWEDSGSKVKLASLSLSFSSASRRSGSSSPSIG